MKTIQHDTLTEAELPGIRHRTVAGKQLGSGAVEVWKQTIDGETETPPHFHDCEEVIVLLSGTGRMVVGDDEIDVPAAATVVVPPQETHQLVNPGSDPLSLLAVLTDPEPGTFSPDGSPLELPW